MKILVMEDSDIRKSFSFVDGAKYLSVNVSSDEDKLYRVNLVANGLKSNEALALFDYIVRPYFSSANSRLNIPNDSNKW